MIGFGLDASKRLRVMRSIVGVLVASGFAAAAGACGAAAWPDPCPRKSLAPRECAVSLSKEVCNWSASKHAEYKKTLDGVVGNGYVLLSGEQRCGCTFQWFTECFLATEMNADGYYVVATGAPGCESSKVFGNVSLSIDRGQCGSIGQVVMRQGAIGP